MQNQAVDSERICVGGSYTGVVPKTLSPRIRARTVRDAIAAIEVFETGAQQDVRDRIPDASWQVIAGALPLDWVALEHDRHVVTAFLDVLGPERAHLFFRGVLAQQLESSLLKSTVTTALRLFGATPAGMARAFPVGFATTYRDVGRVRVIQQGVGATSIVFDELAAEVLDTPAYPESFRGFFAGFFDVCRVDGDVQSTIERGAGRIEFALRWTV